MWRLRPVAGHPGCPRILSPGCKPRIRLQLCFCSKLCWLSRIPRDPPERVDQLGNKQVPPARPHLVAIPRGATAPSCRERPHNIRARIQDSALPSLDGRFKLSICPMNAPRHPVNAIQKGAGCRVVSSPTTLVRHCKSIFHRSHSFVVFRRSRVP